jgi:hypothetical protein
MNKIKFWLSRFFSFYIKRINLKLFKIVIAHNNNDCLYTLIINHCNYYLLNTIDKIEDPNRYYNFDSDSEYCLYWTKLLSKCNFNLFNKIILGYLSDDNNDIDDYMLELSNRVGDKNYLNSLEWDNWYNLVTDYEDKIDDYVSYRYFSLNTEKYIFIIQY